VDSNTFIQLAVTETNGTIVNLAITNTANADLPTFTQNFLNLINTNTSPSLQDSTASPAKICRLIIPHRCATSPARPHPGYAAAQIQATLTSSLGVAPSGAHL